MIDERDKFDERESALEKMKISVVVSFKFWSKNEWSKRPYSRCILFRDKYFDDDDERDDDDDGFDEEREREREREREMIDYSSLFL